MQWSATHTIALSKTTLTLTLILTLIGCIEQLLKTQWSTYTTALAKTTCKAEQRRLLLKGPPVNISDAKALACPDDAEVHSLWYMVDNLERSAKLEGSLAGEVSS
jgi:hypothetical protein